MRMRFDRYSDETINTSLIYLRAKIIRDGLGGLEHVEALLRARGVCPPRVPPKRVVTFGRNEVARLALDALREGPLGVGQIVRMVHAKAPNLPRRAVYKRVKKTFKRLERDGAVVRDGRLCRLTQPAANTPSTSG